MSRIGKQIIDIPSGVTANQQGSELTVTGPKGSLNIDLPACVKLDISESGITVQVENEKEKKQRATW